ncbi:ficolin-3-like [Dysidea avara]|uniref:ficolin-3-like n=1 Tax=Dysidea avara TaxID=196820 RepID=UPI0033241EB5
MQLYNDQSTTFTTILLLLAIGTVTVLAECPKENAPIKNCCCLGFNTSVFNKRKSGVYTMVNFCGVKCYDAEVYCDTVNGGGGWLVVQRRQDGSVDFNRTWGEYEDGFGELIGEFWYGLRALHCLNGQGGWEMRMDIKDKYKLTVGGFQGTTTDPMEYHNGLFFTTKDSDNDEKVDDNCALANNAIYTNGGWWFKNCWRVAPNIYGRRDLVRDGSRISNRGFPVAGEL